MPHRPAKPEAIVAVLRRDGRVLVIRRGPGVVMPGYWTPLTGRIEPGESQPDALVREIREEVGLETVAVAKVWECETDDGGYLLHWWTAELVTDELRLDWREVADARWVTPGEFLRMSPTFSGDREFFTQVLPGL